jgi:two-component system, response regulator
VAEHIILLVEDSYDDRLLTLRALKKNNIDSQVIMATDGVEALSFLRGKDQFEGRTLPGVVLLDLKLPKIDGLEVLRQMRDYPETSLVPVVILSSSAEPRDRLQSYRLGANSYIRKPVDFMQFVDTMKQLQNYWFGLNEGPPCGIELG